LIRSLTNLDGPGHGSLQARLRERISEAIARGDFAENEPLPSTRALADQLKVSRNTVTLVYQELAAEGVLTSEGRRGFFVSPNAAAELPKHLSAADEEANLDWDGRLVVRPSEYSNISHPKDWRSKRYTFIYGQHDRWVFPISNWRKCSRESLSLHDMHDWTVDYVDGDDPLLLDAFRRRVLPRRGFTADASQILVTVGAQHALQLAAQCLVKPGTVVGVEDPCYPDARNIFRLFGAVLKPLRVDEQGVVVDEDMIGCDVVYVTPGHQSPTTVSMSGNRRQALLQAARRWDFVIIEDDYDTESRFGRSGSALKSADRDGRVIYLTSLSKLLSPGLRVGFLVGPRRFVTEARALRRLSIRHPAANNQRTVALFLKGGHYEALLKRFHQNYEHRWRTLRDALARHFPEGRIASSDGGSSIWLRMPEDVDTAEFAKFAYERHVHIEPGHPHFLGPNPPMNYLRFGFSSIRAEDIPQGIAILAEVADDVLPGRVGRTSLPLVASPELPHERGDTARVGL
jgi:GntR family transcriptional regulator/MocR family aminotransferase